MNDLWVTILSAIAGSALINTLITTVLTERIKVSIKNEYDRKLESHKAQLKVETDKELASFSQRLEIASAEQRFVFAKLHEMRAEVIANTYARLKDLYLKLGDYIKIFEASGDKPRPERRSIAIEAHQKFNECFQEKLIFFPKQTADKLESINLDIVRAFNEFTYGVEMANQMGTNSAEKWHEVFTRLNGGVLDALRELENDFRTLLGD